MPVQIRLLPGAISDLFAQASSTNQITLADRYGLLAALLEESITEEERASIDRLLYALYRGRLKVAAELSTLSYQPSQPNWLVPSMWVNQDIDRIMQWQKPSAVPAPAYALSK